MRLLYITAGFPYPLTSGYLRHYFLLRHLGERHRITLLALAGPGFTPEHADALRPFAEDVVAFPAARVGPWAKRWRKANAVLAGRPAPAPAALAAAAARVLSERSYDAVLFSGKQTYPALRRLDGIPVVVDMCDAASLRIDGHARVAPPSRKLPLLASRTRARRIERRLAAAADELLFASARDREALGLDGRGLIVPNGIDLDYWRRESQALGRAHVVFTGAMAYAPNVDAARRLAREVMPQVRAAVPGAHLWLVGRDPAPEVAELGSLPETTVTGLVDDVRPYLERASVFAAPLRFGAGIQNKLLEAMAMSVPSITSPLAAAGLRVDGASAPMAEADTAEEFAEAIVHALRRADADPSPDAGARAWVSARFSWLRSVELVEQALERAAARRGSTPVPAGRMPVAASKP